MTHKFLYLEKANALGISKILEALSHPSASLDPSIIRDQAYDGAAVTSGEVGNVHA